MKRVVLVVLLATSSYAGLKDISSFEADFTQNILDDKGTKIEYSGHITATKQKFALWQYIKPIEKSVYILSNKIIVIEPEIEQAIIKHIDENFDLFRVIQSANKIAKNKYLAKFNNKSYLIEMNGDKISSISYQDELENNIQIFFHNQKVNVKIAKERFIPVIPDEYDVIREK